MIDVLTHVCEPTRLIRDFPMFKLAITHSTPVGLVAGLLWGTALGATVATSLIIGVAGGILLGILLGLYGIAATASGNVSVGEAAFFLGSILGVLTWAFVGSGVVAWGVRLIFF